VAKRIATSATLQRRSYGHRDVASDAQHDRQRRSAVLAPSELDGPLDGIDDERRAE